MLTPEFQDWGPPAYWPLPRAPPGTRRIGANICELAICPAGNGSHSQLLLVCEVCLWIVGGRQGGDDSTCRDGVPMFASAVKTWSSDQPSSSRRWYLTAMINSCRLQSSAPGGCHTD